MTTRPSHLQTFEHIPSATVPFSDLPVLGALPPKQAAAKLREQGESQAAEQLTDVQSKGIFDTIEWPFQDRPWQHTAHAFGYIPMTAAGSEPIPITFAGNMAADESLRGQRIKVTLNGLRVADYPGGGVHHILFDFYAQNQTVNGAEDLHFNATYRARSGEKAATVGYPIFSGLNVGQEGILLKCYTVNVQNDDDQALLDLLDTDVFKAGLTLISTVQPAIAPLSALALGMTRTLAQHHQNVPIQDFALGLDFGSIPGGLRLAQGTYLAVQIPESMTTAWNWNEWVYDPTNGQVVNRDNPSQLIPYNAILFGVSRFEER